MFAVIPETLKG